jgi:hypothetical protein
MESFNRLVPPKGLTDHSSYADITPSLTYTFPLAGTKINFYFKFNYKNFERYNIKYWFYTGEVKVESEGL